MARMLGRQGAPVDVRGEQAFDPTQNVKDINESANKRQDDLREANNKLTEAEIRRLDAEIDHAKELSNSREQCAKELAEVREQHARELRSAETSRLDSIRQVDVTAVRTEADRALAAIQTLAATSASNAENIRNNLNATAATIAKTTSDSMSQITERIAALEKSSYEGVGKQRLADPQMIDLLAEVKALRESRANITGVTQGIDKTWGVLAVIITIVISATAMAINYSRSPSPVVSVPLTAPVPLPLSK